MAATGPSHSETFAADAASPGESPYATYGGVAARPSGPARTIAGELIRVAEHLETLYPDAPLLSRSELHAGPPAGGNVESCVALLQQVIMSLEAHGRAALSVVPSRRSNCALAKKLNLDALTLILQFLDVQSLNTMACTSFAFHRLIFKSDVIWRSMCDNVFPMYHAKVATRPKPPTANGQSVWRAIFHERVEQDGPWLRRSAELPVPSRTFNCPRGIHAVLFDERSLLVGSGLYNEVVSVDLSSGVRHSGANGAGMFGHQQAVTCLKTLTDNKNMLLTGSLDGTLRLFNRERMAQIRCFNGHTDKVWCVEAVGDRVFSGGSDKTIRVWDINNATEVTAPLCSHKTSISSLRIVHGNLLMSGSAGNTIRAWDLGEGEPRCVQKLRGHMKGVFCLRSTPTMLMSGSLVNVIKVWDPRQSFRLVFDLIERDRTGAPIISEATDMDTTTGIITFDCDDTKLVSGGPDKVIKVWDLRMKRIVNTLVGHQHWVTTLQMDGSKVVSGSRDKTLRFWDIDGRLNNTLHPSLGS